MRTFRADLLGLLLMGTLANITSAQNVTEVLAKYPSYSSFNNLLTQTGVISEVSSRSSLTILLPQNALLDTYVAAHPSYTSQMLADVCRYHVLLQFLDSSELRTMQVNGGMVTSLFQTTGRANGLDGFVNITLQPSGTVAVGPSTAGTPPQATILGNVAQYPYNYSFFQVDTVLEPLGLGPAQLAPTAPPSLAPVPAPVPAIPLVPGIAPIPAIAPVPGIAPVPATAPVPSLAPVPVPSPAMTPVLPPQIAPTPAVTPALAPVPVPSTATPVPAPSTTPGMSPLVSPPAPPTNGPSVIEPPVVGTPVTSPTPSAAFSTAHFSFAAIVASVVIAVALLSL